MLAGWVDQLLGFADKARATIQNNEQYPELVRWARNDGASLLGGDLALAQALTPQLWNQMPLVRCGYSPEPLAEPDPLEPCWCDSGKRYRDCCGAVVLPGPIPLNLMWMLSLKEWRGERLRQALEVGKAPPQALLEAAIISAETGQLGRAQRILEAFFRLDDWSAVPEASEPAFELLTDVYQERGFTRKKADFVDQVVDRGPPFLKGAALERICLAFIDADNLADARDAFLRALKTIPDAPSLAYIETMLLLHEGRQEEAGSRADFWLRRLSRHPDIDPDYIDFLEVLADDPVAALAEQMVNSEEELAEPLTILQDMLEELPTAEPLNYEHNVEGRLEYHVSERHEHDYTQWQDFFGIHESQDSIHESVTDPWPNAQEWLSELCQHPNWLDSPMVLQKLAMALAVRFGNLPWMIPAFFVPIATRLDTWLAPVEAANEPFLWQDGDNEVLFRLGLSLVIGMERGDVMRSRTLAQRLLRLDRDDNLGLRELLLEQLLREGDNEQALAMVEALTDDEQHWPGLTIGKALVMFRLGRLEEAEQSIMEVHRYNEHLPGLMMQTSPRREVRNDNVPEPGSRGEAWQYRVLMRDQWVSTPGAIEFLRQVMRRLR